MNNLRTAVLAAALLSSAVMAGFYATFSVMVMPALGRLATPKAASSMQAINRAAPAPWLVFGLVIAGGSSASVGVSAVLDWQASGSAWALAGALLYLSTVVLTVAYHVPLNNRLALLQPSEPGAEASWQRYLHDWTTANHFRAVLALAAAVVLTVGTVMNIVDPPEG
jgi:uncharacterized membrane protein